MKKTNLKEIGTKLADGLGESIGSNRPQLSIQLLRFLAEGHPVSLDQLATELPYPRDEVKIALRQMPSTEFDQEGNIVGSVVTLNPTPHHFHINGQDLFTWCALDTLFVPIILKQTARVESTCPVTAGKVQLTVTPRGVNDLEPNNALVSIVIPEASEACCDVRGAFCNHSNFIYSPEAASHWLKENPEAIILTVEDAHQLSGILTEQLFKEF